LSEKLLRWFERKRKDRAVAMLQDHAALTMAISTDLVEVVRCSMEGRLVRVNKIHKAIEMMERKADSLRRGIVDELARGDLPSSDRADLMRLARRMDWVADWAHESSRILIILLPVIEDIWRSSERLKVICLNIVDKLEECTRNLVDAIKSMAEGNLEEMLARADKVERNEEEVDALYEDARKEFLNLDAKDIPIGGQIIFSQFLDALEEMADNCEHTCDQLRVIGVGIISRPKKAEK